mmetsp:Transcript_21624/g.40370  ORF Transcript_21624/g.40370 Transcript_21624/m.40370 type:complete len:284 (-) Transcript_21624:358-1209(-)
MTASCCKSLSPCPLINDLCPDDASITSVTSKVVTKFSIRSFNSLNAYASLKSFVYCSQLASVSGGNDVIPARPMRRPVKVPDVPPSGVGLTVGLISSTGDSVSAIVGSIVSPASGAIVSSTMAVGSSVTTTSIGCGVGATGANVGSGVTGAAVGATGAAVGATGAAVGETGAAVGATGAAVGATGAAVGATGAVVGASVVASVADSVADSVGASVSGGSVSGGSVAMGSVGSGDDPVVGASVPSFGPSRTKTKNLIPHTQSWSKPSANKIGFPPGAESSSVKV